jgi:UDP-2,3-diacylglucosamine pyrophosphatase LpxH
MTTAVSMVKVVPGHEKSVYNMLKNLEMTRRLYHIFGNHDFLLFLEAESIAKLTH